MTDGWWAGSYHQIMVMAMVILNARGQPILGAGTRKTMVKMSCKLLAFSSFNQTRNTHLIVTDTHFIFLKNIFGISPDLALSIFKKTHGIKKTIALRIEYANCKVYYQLWNRGVFQVILNRFVNNSTTRVRRSAKNVELAPSFFGSGSMFGRDVFRSFRQDSLLPEFFMFDIVSIRCFWLGCSPTTPISWTTISWFVAPGMTRIE